MFIAGCILAGIGAVFLVLGIIFFAVGKSTWHCTEAVTGQIVDMCKNAYEYNYGGTGNIKIRTGSGSTNTRCPVFIYIVNGIEYRRASNVAWDIGSIQRKMQQPQTVYYNPANPMEASLVKQSVFTILGKVFIPVGAALILIGVALILF